MKSLDPLSMQHRPDFSGRLSRSLLQSRIAARLAWKLGLELVVTSGPGGPPHTSRLPAEWLLFDRRSGRLVAEVNLQTEMVRCCDGCWHCSSRRGRISPLVRVAWRYFKEKSAKEQRRRLVLQKSQE